jgi:threonine dehydratase
MTFEPVSAVVPHGPPADDPSDALAHSSDDDVPVTPDDIDRAAALIAEHVRRTPVIDHDGVCLKLELLQHTGSFKVRGAFHRILSERALPDAGVIAASGGNHGAAVAFAASQLGIAAEVIIPATSPVLKRTLIERHGAQVRVVDGYYDDAQRVAEERQAETGALMLHPFDHPATIAGQGTMARELEEQLGGIDTLVVASGGGGFTAGQAAWFRDRVRVVSAEPETSQCLRAALAAGAPVAVTVAGVAADSLGANQLGRVPWEIVRRYVDEAVIVGDDAIRDTQRAIWDDLRLISEPGGATALAALRTGAYRPTRGERVAVALCGSNCDPATVLP